MMLGAFVFGALLVVIGAMVAQVQLTIKQQGAVMTKTFDDIQAQMAKLQDTAGEIATDVADLVSRIGSGSADDGGLTKDEATQIANELGELGTKLSDVAAAYTPPTPAQPPAPPAPSDQGDGGGTADPTDNNTL